MNGRKTHPTSFKNFRFGVRPDVTFQIENPVKTHKLRCSSKHDAHLHPSEFAIHNVSPTAHPEALSPNADKDKPGLEWTEKTPIPSTPPS